MGIVVDHEQRKTVILKKALDVIIEEGYEDATFQKIADRCGITRTTLYIYFKNKREIFLWSIKQLTEGLEIALQDIIGDTSRSCKERLLAVLEGIVHGCIENRQLFQVILAYLIQVQKTGKNPGDRVRRRIVRLPAQKDDTDLEAALSLVLAHYPPENIDRILILGALGAGRLDHLLANVWLAHQPRFAAYLTKMLWLEHNNRMQFFRAGEHVWQHDADKKYVSFIGMTPIESLSLSGLLYPLNNAQFAHPMALVSNECLGSEMRFSFKSGLLCGIQSSDLPPSAAAK